MSGSFKVSLLSGTFQPRWYTLKGRSNSKKKKDDVSGEIQVQFALADTSDPAATPQELLQKLSIHTASGPEDSEDEDELKLSQADTASLEDDDGDDSRSTSDGVDDGTSKPEDQERRKRRLRMKRLKRKSKARTYEFTGSGDCVGVIFLEITKILDLPPEKNGKHA